MKFIGFKTSIWPYSKDIFETYVAPIVQDLAVKSTEYLSDPIIRAPYYADPTDENTFAVDDQFMLGQDLMIAPIVEPMNQGKSFVKVLKINGSL